MVKVQCNRSRTLSYCLARFEANSTKAAASPTNPRVWSANLISSYNLCMVTQPPETLPPTFPRQDPATPAFWDVRFAAEFTPWDRGGAPQNLRDFLSMSANTPRKALIPGCGAAREVTAFANAGWPVTAIDFSAEAVARAKAVLGPHSSLVEHGDFFNPNLANEGFALVYESAFLCALPPDLRTAWAAQISRILFAGDSAGGSSSGLLAGYFFFGESPKGPPFGISRPALLALLSPAFELVEDVEPQDSIAVFRGRERWMVWCRRP